MKVYKITIDDYIKIVELAKKMGIKEGQSMQPALDIYIKCIKKLEEIGNFKNIEDLRNYLNKLGYKNILDLTKET